MARIIRSPSYLLICVLYFLFISCTYAAGNTHTLSPRVYKQLSAIVEVYEKESTEYLAKTLQKLNKVTSRNAFDRAYINRFKGNIYWQLGQKKEAMIALKSAVAENALDAIEQQQCQRMLADLYLEQKKPKEAITLYKALLELTENEKLREALYEHLAIAYYQQKSWRQLVNTTHKAIKYATTFNQRIHVLQLSALYELNDYKAARNTLLKLNKAEPDNKRWWMQLASTYRLLKQDNKALATYELAYLHGFINDSREIKQLASLRASLGVPYQAALLLESAINKKQVAGNAKNYQQLAIFWQMAHEHNNAQQYWGKSAALSGNAQHVLKQAQLLYLLRRYKDALSVLAFAASNLATLDNMQLQGLIALSRIQTLFALKHYSEASQLARLSVKNHSIKKRALQWLKLLDNY